METIRFEPCDRMEAGTGARADLGPSSIFIGRPRDLDPQLSLGLLDAALEVTDTTPDPPVNDKFGSYHAFVRARVNSLPPGGRPPQPAVYTRDHRATIAARFLASLPTTYVEVSPSGNGFHVWGKGDLDRGRRLTLPDGLKVEAYATGRYITFTGRVVTAGRLGDLSGVLDRITT